MTDPAHYERTIRVLRDRVWELEIELLNARCALDAARAEVMDAQSDTVRTWPTARAMPPPDEGVSRFPSPSSDPDDEAPAPTGTDL